MKNRISAFLLDMAATKGRALSVCFFGFGATSRAIFDIIHPLPCCRDITVRQHGTEHVPLPKGIRRVDVDTDAAEVDVVFLSPSVRREALTFPSDTVVTSDVDLFFGDKRENLFLISGSDGKSTVTTLTSLLLFPRFPDLFTGGNIGVPLALASTKADAFVIELSSFNLRYTSPIGGRAVLTNVTPNHLNWHADLSEYESCKKRLIDSADEAVLYLGCPFSERIARSRRSFALISDTKSHREVQGQYRTEHAITLEEGCILLDSSPLLQVCDVKRSERHNLLNLMSAIAMTVGYTDANRIREVASTFQGLSHRCEKSNIDGVYYIDSSIDTTPERTRTTLLGLDQRVRIILGGRGKGLSLDPLRAPLLQYADRISVYGDIGKEMLAWISNDAELSRIPHQAFDSLAEAIEYAKCGINPTDTVLLSPAATSYGEFADYRERGEFFKTYIEKATEI